LCDPVRWVNLYFLDGVALADPMKLLGSGNRVRSLRLDDPKVIDTPAVKALVAEAIRNVDAPVDPKRARRLVIKSIAPKQRPRRPL
jgi:hypothetical protein